MKQLKISVVTIVFNDVAHILSTINNVDSQTARSRMEYIVVDGKSTDGTSEVISANSSRIDRYICEKDNGIYNAMNKGLRAATGDYIIFINSGDVFSSTDVVEKVLAALQVPSALPALVYGSYQEVGNNAVCSRIIPCRSADKIWYGPVASHQSTFYNLSFLKNCGLSYDESYRIAADYKLTLQVIKLSHHSCLRLPLCISNFDTSGISNTNMDAGLYEAHRVRQQVLGWSPFRCKLLTGILLTARYSKKYIRPIYDILRY